LRGPFSKAVLTAIHGVKPPVAFATHFPLFRTKHACPTLGQQDGGLNEKMENTQ
jgi:hypothetical protein